MLISGRENRMANDSNHNFANPNVWIRLLYMIMFWFLLVLARFAVGLLAVLQFVLVLLTGAPNEPLRAMGGAIGVWTLQTMRFLTFSSEDKPFPFQDWPIVEDDVVASNSAVVEAAGVETTSPEDRASDTPYRT